MVDSPGHQTEQESGKAFQSFSQDFEALTGFPPLKWQTRLYTEYFAQGKLPSSVDIPTGLGKTAVMVLWWLARQSNPSLPRRLVYVVDRRAVVDQATAFADSIYQKVGGQRLSISTLRGQHVDQRKWVENPARPAIVVGTVDMVGSRLLFEGYGVSRKRGPITPASSALIP